MRFIKLKHYLTFWGIKIFVVSPLKDSFFNLSEMYFNEMIEIKKHKKRKEKLKKEKKKMKKRKSIYKIKTYGGKLK